MLSSLGQHSYIALTIIFTLYGELVVKWQVDLAGPTPDAFMGKLQYLGRMLMNPWIISVYASTFLAAMFWMLTLSKFDISYAYPYVSLTFPLILLAGVLVFSEPVSWHKVAGVTLIVAGIVVHSQS